MQSEISEATISFEGVKTSFVQTSKGVKVTFEVNPLEVPNDLVTAPIGQRYMIVIVGIDDDETPIPAPDKSKSITEAQSAGMLCRSVNFQGYMVHLGYADAKTEGQAAGALRDILKIKTRSEIGKDQKVREEWVRLKNQFEQWAKTSSA